MHVLMGLRFRYNDHLAVTMTRIVIRRQAFIPAAIVIALRGGVTRVFASTNPAALLSAHLTLIAIRAGVLLAFGIFFFRDKYAAFNRGRGFKSHRTIFSGTRGPFRFIRTVWIQEALRREQALRLKRR